MISDKQKRTNELRLNGLLPEVREIAVNHIKGCAEVGIDVVVVETFRTSADQADKWAQGRTKPGPIITHAQPGYSWHEFGRAYDLAVLVGGKLTWTGPDYERIGQIGKNWGLIWGGDFKRLHGDVGHFEYHPGSTLAQARADRFGVIGMT